MLFTYSKYSVSVNLDIMHSKVANFLQDDYIINAYVDGNSTGLFSFYFDDREGTGFASRSVRAVLTKQDGSYNDNGLI